METVKKYGLWCIFISILCVFAMSHNASALNLNYENYSLKRSLRNPTLTCYGLENGVNTQRVNLNPCLFPVTSNMGFFDITSVQVNQRFSYSSFSLGDIVEYYLLVGTYNNNTLNSGNLELKSIAPAQGSVYFTPLGYEVIDQSDFLNYIAVNQNLPGESVGFVSDFWSNDRTYKVYRITHLFTGGQNQGDIVLGFSDSANRMFNLYAYDSNNYEIRLVLVNQYTQTESKENKEVEEKTQDAVDDSQAAGGSSSQDAQTGTTGLLNAITGAVSVISSASPTNCKINGNMGNLDIGQLDLCANPAPAFIQTIGSLILILMCVPLAISLFNRFISIFRSFQS